MIQRYRRQIDENIINLAGMEGLQVRLGSVRVRWRHGNLRPFGAYLASGHHLVQQVSVRACLYN